MLKNNFKAGNIPAFILCKNTIYLIDYNLGALNMQQVQENKLIKMVVDLEKVKKFELQEKVYTDFANQIKKILSSLFKNTQLPMSVKGRPSEVKSFAEAIKKETEYINAIKEHGLEDPKTVKSKFQLERAVKEFERRTGIRWPFE